MCLNESCLIYNAEYRVTLLLYLGGRQRDKVLTGHIQREHMLRSTQNNK